MPVRPRIAVSLTVAALLLGSCGGKDADEAPPDTGASAEYAPDNPGATSTPAPAANPTSTPLTVADVERWEKGIAGEMQAVQEGAAKMKTARSGEDTLNAMMAVQEMTTIPVGAKAAGLDEERYKFVRSTLSAAVSYLAPLELEGMDTTKMPEDMRDELRRGREAQLQQLSSVVPADLVATLKPRAAELRKKDLELVGARLKGVGQ